MKPYNFLVLKICLMEKNLTTALSVGGLQYTDTLKYERDINKRGRKWLIDNCVSCLRKKALTVGFQCAVAVESFDRFHKKLKKNLRSAREKIGAKLKKTS